MIRSFFHKGLEKFFSTGNKAGIQPSHAKRLRLKLIFRFEGKDAVRVDYVDYH